MPRRRMSPREWVEKYKSFILNNEIVKVINKPELKVSKFGSWSFLKLCTLFSYAYYTYLPIIGKRYKNRWYIDMFSGPGLISFEDSSKNQKLAVGSPLLMATLKSGEYSFTKCIFFENDPKCRESLEERIKLLEEHGLLACKDVEVYGDCNKDIDKVVSKFNKTGGLHVLVFIDPYCTEINWKTMEKLFKRAYPRFDMLFNFLPYGINRKMGTKKEDLKKFYGNSSFEECLRYSGWGERKFMCLLIKYIKRLETLNKFPEIRIIRIQSGGKSAFYYDLIYATSKEDPGYIKAIEHLSKVMKEMTGQDVSIILDEKIIPLSASESQTKKSKKSYLPLDEYL